MKILSAAIILVLASLAANAATGGPWNNPAFYASTFRLPDGGWEITVSAMVPHRWVCKGRLHGQSEDMFNLPAQTVAVTCVNGPAAGQITLIPDAQTRFAKFQYRLDNGHRGSTNLH